MIEHTQEQIEDVKKLEAILTGLRNNNVDEADIDRDDYYCYVMHLDWVGLAGCAKGNAVLDNVEFKYRLQGLLRTLNRKKKKLRVDVAVIDCGTNDAIQQGHVVKFAFYFKFNRRSDFGESFDDKLRRRFHEDVTCAWNSWFGSDYWFNLRPLLDFYIGSGHLNYFTYDFIDNPHCKDMHMYREDKLVAMYKKGSEGVFYLDEVDEEE